MFGRIRPEFPFAVEGLDTNFNDYKNWARIPMFGTMRSKFQCVTK